MVHVDLDEIDPDRQDTSSCGGTDDSIGEVSYSVVCITVHTHIAHELLSVLLTSLSSVPKVICPYL